ncbi:9752_t:CDS:2 [Funneliformis mosseae]|uniref:9752_t:CDS:1 n=1 Tax=Funneliformis mosseae TaxID=27381 RepID=A0A9N9FI60_FUNMO|nr:9752_t:CDS:2 [Funneliformis mosseae]
MSTRIDDNDNISWITSKSKLDDSSREGTLVITIFSSVKW